MSGSLPHPPFRRVAAELAFRSTLVAYCRAAWHLDSIHEQELPPGPCFIYGNHSNNYDPFIYNAFTRLGESTAGVMTMECLASGPVAALFRATGIEGTRKRVPEPHLIRRIYRMLDEGRRIVIFPEGGRRWDGRPAPWIESTAKLFMRAGAPVHPVEIVGSYVGWPRWAPWPRPARIRLKIHPALDFSDCPTLEEGLRRLKAPIAADETLVDPAVRPAWAFRPAVGLDRLLYRDAETGEFGGWRVEDGWHATSDGGRRRWQVLPDSRLQEGSLPPVSTADLYAELRALPLPDPSRGPILHQHARTWMSGRGVASWQDLRLYHDRVEWGEESLPLERIQYMGLERSDRIWLLSDKGQFNAFFPSGSVLAWYDTLGRLSPHINA
ncbi:MAG: lysophospholipid acyltransferase family protein [Bacteroidetes bacterium]|nr:lysophospholipid acyltransferase family protein [Bacteroidota bacterium]